jgi:hypothetical protein
VTEEMFGRQNRIDEADMGRAGWDDVSEKRNGHSDAICVLPDGCFCAHKKRRIKSLEIADVVRDNAVIVHVKF